MKHVQGVAGRDVQICTNGPALLFGTVLRHRHRQGRYGRHEGLRYVLHQYHDVHHWARHGHGANQAIGPAS